MGAQVCKSKKQEQSSTIIGSYHEKQGFEISGEENIKETDDDSIDLFPLHVKVLNTILPPFQDDLLKKDQESIFEKCSQASWQSRQPIQESQWFKSWLEHFTNSIMQDKITKSQVIRKGIRDYQNYFLSFMPVYKKVLINDQIFFKIRQEPIKQFYTMDKKIGQGAFGSVYEGVCKKTGEKRAIKIMKKKFMKENDYESFKNEVNILRKMDHINIIKIYDVFSFSNFFYVVTQYCSGGSLLQAFQKSKIRDEKIIKIVMKQILSALFYMHEKNIVHRDMKLQNLVLVQKFDYNYQENLCVKIIDFGLAIKVSQNHGNKCGHVGTPSYMAPEILQGSFSLQSDVWSAGIIFCLLVTGQNPFKQKQMKKTFNNIINKQINFKQDPLFKNLSPQILNLLAKMLQKIPYKRISSKNAIKHPFIQEIIVGSVKNIKKKSLIVNNITNYTRGNNFNCFIKNFLISKNMSQSKRQEMAIIFEKIDIDASGMIDKEELKELYRIVTGSSTDEAEEHIRKIDQNQSEKIDFHEFLLVMTNDDLMSNQEYLKSAFQFIDTDKTGYIDRQEILACLVGCQEQEIISIIECIDGDGDGKISWQQFRHSLMEIKL